MKKLTLIILSALVILMAFNLNTPKNDASNIYNTLVTAAEESRELTEDEVALIEDWQIDAVSFDNTNELDHVIHAMYFNFYETLGEGEATHFNIAKATAKDLLN